MNKKVFNLFIKLYQLLQKGFQLTPTLLIMDN